MEAGKGSRIINPGQVVVVTAMVLSVAMDVVWEPVGWLRPLMYMLVIGSGALIGMISDVLVPYYRMMRKQNQETLHHKRR